MGVMYVIVIIYMLGRRQNFASSLVNLWKYASHPVVAHATTADHDHSQNQNRGIVLFRRVLAPFLKRPIDHKASHVQTSMPMPISNSNPNAMFYVDNDIPLRQKSAAVPRGNVHGLSRSFALARSRRLGRAHRSGLACSCRGVETPASALLLRLCALDLESRTGARFTLPR